METAERTLHVTPAEALHALQRLEREGYLIHELVPTATPGRVEPVWRTTLKGNQLANASAAKPVRRQTAERALADFLERVEQVNQRDEYVYAVERVILFGSYLGTSPTVGDLDLAVGLRPKYDEATMPAAAQRRRQQAASVGRSFSNVFEQAAWPRTEVYRFLKGRSRLISLHELGSEQILDQGIATRVIFEESTNTP